MDANILHEILTGYKDLLHSRYPRHLKKFRSLEANDPDAAKFEAVCFSIFRSYEFQVAIGEDDKTGGPDFLCSNKMGKFALEATTINTISMEIKTGMKNDQREILGGSYRAYPTLYQKLESKVRQVSGYSFPRIVAIGSFHNEALTLFRNILVDEYLHAFLGFDKFGNLQPNETLKHISALILVGFGDNECIIIGILNPKPVYPFSIKFLPDIAFRRITESGLKEKTGEGEWVKYKSDEVELSFRYHLQPIR